MENYTTAYIDVTRKPFFYYYLNCFFKLYLFDSSRNRHSLISVVPCRVKTVFAFEQDVSESAHLSVLDGGQTESGIGLNRTDNSTTS